MALMARAWPIVFFVGLLVACGDGEEGDVRRDRLRLRLHDLGRMAFQSAGVAARDAAELAFDSASVEKPFFIDRFEVTNRAFADFVEATGYEGTGPGFLHHWTTVEGKRRCPVDREDDPVVWVSYRDAVAYSEWRGMRLPRAAEWQLAARGDTERPYPWGRSTDVSTRANVLSTRFFRSAPVGFFESGRSDIGCYDLVGNVWEWSATPGPRPGTRLQLGGAFNTPAGSVARTSVHPFLGDGDLWLQGEANRSADRGFRCCVDAEAFLETVMGDLSSAPDLPESLQLRAALERHPAEARTLAATIARRHSSADWVAELEPR